MNGEGITGEGGTAPEEPTPPSSGVGTQEPIQYSGAEQTAAPGSRRGLFLGLGIGLAILVLVIAYLTTGALMAGAANGSADKALKSTLSHQEAVINLLNQDPFRGIDFSSPTADMSSAKAALSSYEPQLPKVGSLIKSDRAALQKAKGDLQANFFMLPESGPLSKKRHRVDAALKGLDAAQNAVDLDSKAIAFLKPVFDGLGQMQDLVNKMTADNFDGALAEVGPARSSFQRASSLANPPAIPPQMRPALQRIDKFLVDIEQFLKAAKSQDVNGVRDASTALDADSKALGAVDTSAMQTYVDGLTKSYQDSYNSSMKQASQG